MATKHIAPGARGKHASNAAITTSELRIIY
jgi:hypothetical protein